MIPPTHCSALSIPFGCFHTTIMCKQQTLQNQVVKKIGKQPITKKYMTEGANNFARNDGADQHQVDDVHLMALEPYV